uniref:Mesencephalic astrocyte-derived neurotrophic factor homolog n=1 Tax=Rhabditophanes sp. KR3021 TaxID=114890 RepID=A0AC35U752_9BILA
MKLLIAVALVFVAVSSIVAQECEVCTKVLGDAMLKVPAADANKADKIADVIRAHCKTTRNKEHKLCLNIGALPESASSIMADVSKPLSWSMPAEKVCLKIKSKDAQICELKYDKDLDWKTIDLNKLRVKELKKILDNWGEVCKGCTEKNELITKINELKPKYVKTEL